MWPLCPKTLSHLVCKLNHLPLLRKPILRFISFFTFSFLFSLSFSIFLSLSLFLSFSLSLFLSFSLSLFLSFSLSLFLSFSLSLFSLSLSLSLSLSPLSLVRRKTYSLFSRVKDMPKNLENKKEPPPLLLLLFWELDMLSETMPSRFPREKKKNSSQEGRNLTKISTERSCV